MEDRALFLVFGVIQVIALGFIVYFVLGSLGTLEFNVRVVLSSVFSLFTLVVEYMIYSKV